MVNPYELVTSPRSRAIVETLWYKMNVRMEFDDFFQECAVRLLKYGGKCEVDIVAMFNNCRWAYAEIAKKWKREDKYRVEYIARQTQQPEYNQTDFEDLIQHIAEVSKLSPKEQSVFFAMAKDMDSKEIRQKCAINNRQRLDQLKQSIKKKVQKSCSSMICAN